MLSRLIFLLAATLGLCSCGVYQAATYDGPSDENYVLMEGVLAPPVMITGVWPDTYAKNFGSASYYTGLIRSRNEGRMTPERARDILNAMDQVFHYVPVHTMSEAQLAELLGAPDKKVVLSGRTMYRYQFNSPEGLQGRWLVRK